MTRDKNNGGDVDPSAQTRAEARADVVEQQAPVTGEGTVTSSEDSAEERAAQQREAAEAAAKYDSESRVRETHWRPVGLLISAVAIILAVYHMYTAYFGTPPTLIHRSLHVSVILFLVFMIYPPARRFQGNGWRIADGALAVASLVPTIYMILNYEEFVLQAGRFNTADIVVASLLVVLVLEAARRVTGIALPILGILFILFGLYGRDMPGLLRHRGYDWDTLAYQFYA